MGVVVLQLARSVSYMWAVLGISGLAISPPRDREVQGGQFPVFSGFLSFLLRNLWSFAGTAGVGARGTSHRPYGKFYQISIGEL
jgi:hypothetical protein